MKNLIIILFFALFLSACSTKVYQTPVIISTEITTSTLMPDPTSTVAPTPTATMERDYSVDYEKVQADPWTATDAEKAGYDIYVRQQLAAAGIENAENLLDYELLEALIEYQQNLIETSSLENPEDYLVELPISLHELIRTDINNVVAMHYDESRDAKYGIGGTVRPSQEDLLREINNIFPDFSIYGTLIQANAHEYQINGDLGLLYKTPGMDPNVGIGAVIQMYDGDRVAYLEVLIPPSTAPINSGDLCMGNQVGELVLPKACPAGAQRTQAYINSKKWQLFELSDLLKLMTVTEQVLQVELTSDGSHKAGAPMWSDGITIATDISILNL
jgi:hypothetical protein